MNRRLLRIIILLVGILSPLGGASQADPDFESLALRADSLDEARNFEQAIQLKKDLIRRYLQWNLPAPEIVDLQIDISRMYRNLGDYGQTLSYLEEAIQYGEEHLQADDPLLARAYNGLGIYYYVQRIPDRALEAFQSAYRIRLDAYGPDHPLVADMLNNLAICYEQMEEYGQALESYHQALNIRIENFGECDGTVADSYLNIGTTWHKLGDFRRALDYYHLAREIYEGDPQQYGVDLVGILNNMGVCYQDRGDYQAAEELLEQALLTNQQLYAPGHPEIAFSLNNLGLNYLDLGDYNKALIFFRQALDIRERSLEPGHPLIARLYNHMASCYLQKKDYQQAYRLARHALEMRLAHFGSQHTDVADSYSDLGFYFESTNQLDSAEINYRDALLIYQQQLGADHPLVGDTYMRLGNLFLEQGQKEEARHHFREAIRIRKKVLGSDHPETARVLSGLAKSMDDPKDGLQLLDDVYHVLQNPDSSDFISLWEVNPIVALEVLTARSTLLRELQDVSWRRERLEEIRRVNDLGLDWIDRAIRVYQEPGSKQLLLDRFYRLLELAMENCLDASIRTGDRFWTERSFMIAERGKGILLRESAAREQARSFAGIPDSLRSREQELLLDISTLERRLFQTPDSLQQPLRIELFSLKKEQYDLLRLLKVNYPEYYQLRYAVWKFDAEPLVQFVRQRNLNILQYFQGDRFTYALLLNSDTVALHRVGPSRDLVASVNRFRTMLTDISSLRDPSPEVPTRYAREALNLYELLIGPLESTFAGDRLLIIPDGVLHYLPFDCLVDTLPGPDPDWKQLRYLLDRFSVGYAYTADMLLEEDLGTRHDVRLLAVAPQFPEEGLLQPLLHNRDEVVAVSGQWAGSLLLGDRATKEIFLKEASRYGLLHLATHAAANDTLGGYSFLAFQPTDSLPESNLLYVRELYNLRLPAELVVLSACETGVGEWQRGEGLISLSRGFFYAGARSLLTSLWKLDDASSASLMATFYEGLHQDMPKDEALRRAKKEYIRTNSALRAHPFFWASFVPVGSMDPVDPPGPGRWLWWLGGGLLALGFLWRLGVIFGK